jgi:DNA-directed RNA polymerase specialized sigma24 family protein/tRNA A-37 threonylcarbamoyl transferase component Bud32
MDPCAELAMARCAAGDHTALGELFDAIAPPLRSHLARRIEAHRIDRIVRTVVLELHRARGSYCSGRAVLPWALAIAHRLLRGQPLAAVASAAIDPECSSSSAHLRRELARLPEPTRSAWELVALDRLTPTEAGAVLGIGRRGARSELARAQLELADAFSELGGTLDDARSSGACTSLPRGTVVLSRYRVERWIGGGAHGDVYLADDFGRAHPVALKVLRSDREQDDAREQRFRREIDILRRVVAPGLVPVLDAGVLPDGRHCYTMEYVRGGSLAQLLCRQPRLPWARVRSIARQLCDTLAAVHASGVVHRDLKPGNCLLEPGDAGHERVRVLDFGVAKLTEPRRGAALTRPGTLVGTPEYMAPEQLRGEPVDARTDLYALGVTLYEMLVGRRPFHGDSLVAIISQQLFASAQRPSTVLGDAALLDADDILLRLLAKDPAHRFASASELAMALDAGASPRVTVRPNGHSGSLVRRGDHGHHGASADELARTG